MRRAEASPAGARAARALPAALFFLLVLAVYADPLFARRNFGGRDLIVYNLPMEAAVHDAYARGRLPVWSAYVSGGRPLLPNPNAGALYPLRALLGFLPFPLAMRVFPLLHWILCGWGAMALLSSLGCSRAAAWTGAVTYAFCGVSVCEAFYPHIQPGMTLLPWIVLALGRTGKPAPARTVLLSLLFGLDFLAGDVFTIGLAILCALLWILLEVDRPGRRGAALSLAAALTLGALLALPQIVATALWIPETNRAILGLKLWDVFFFSVSPWRLLEFFVPYPFGATWALEATSAVWALPLFHFKSVGIFATFYSGAFAVVALLATWKQRSPGVRFARSLLLFGLAVSVLPSLAPASWAGLPSPLALRNPEKLAVAIVFALSILAGPAFDLCRRSASRRRSVLAVAAALALLAGVSALFPVAAGRLAARAVGADARLAPIASARLAGSIAEGGAYWVATLFALELLRKDSSRAALASAILLTGVLLVANRRIAQTFREEELFSPTAFARVIARRDPEGAYRTLGESLYRPSSKISADEERSDRGLTEVARRNWYGQTQVFWRRGSVFNADFDAGDLSRVESLRRLSAFAAGYSDASAFFGSLALRWGIRYRDNPPLPGYRRFGGDASQDWDELPGALPDVRLVESWREEPGALEALRTLPRLKPGEVVIESGSRRQGRAAPGGRRVIERTPERLVLETRSPSPTWLFVLRAHWTHRRVLLDGVEVEARPAQLAFSAVAVPAGTHRIEWSERVPGGEVSRFGPVVFLFAAAALLFGGRRPADPARAAP